MRMEELFEVFDSTYDYGTSKMSPNQERYLISTDAGMYQVVVAEDEEEDDDDDEEYYELITDEYPEVMFGDVQGRSNVTGSFKDKNLNPVRLFGTIMEILKKSRLIRRRKGFHFVADASEWSRVRLYDRFLKEYNLKPYKFIEDGHVYFIVKL